MEFSFVTACGVTVSAFTVLPFLIGHNESGSKKESVRIKLPEPGHDGVVSIERTLLERRSIREYRNTPLSLEEVSQLLWAGQGITDKQGSRTAPSAGALYPLEFYIVAGNVDDLPQGMYRYGPHEHELARLAEDDMRHKLSNASLGQSCVSDCAAVIIVTAVFERTTWKYGERGIRYVHMEVGHAAENICLQAVALNLGTVIVGAFHDGEIKRIMHLPDNEQPMCIIPVGRK